MDNNTSDSDASSLPAEVASEVEALSTYLQDLDLGRRKQKLEELVKHPLHELEHSLPGNAYTSSVMQRVAYVMRGHVPGAFAAAITTGCYAEALVGCYLGGCTFALEPPAHNFDASALDFDSRYERSVSIMVGRANTAYVCRQGWPHGLVIDLNRARERGFTIRPWQEGDYGPAALLRRYSQLRDLVKAAPPDPLPPGNELLCRVLPQEQLRHFDGLHWQMLLPEQPRLLLQASPASPGSSPDPRTQPPVPPPEPPPPPPPPPPDEGRRWSIGLIKPYPWLPCYKEWVVFLLYLGLVVPFDDGMPLLCLSWLPYALAAAGYCGDDLYQRFRHGEFRDTRAIAAERPEGLPANASAQDACAALARACARCASPPGARRPPTPPSVGGAPAAGSLLEPVLTPALLAKCTALAQRFPQPGPAQGTALAPPNFYDRTDQPPNTFEGDARPEVEHVLLLCYVVVARRDVHQRMQDVLGIDCDDSNFFLVIRGSMGPSSGGLQLEAQLGLPHRFFHDLFHKNVRRGGTGFWGVGVFDAEQVRGAVEIAEDETYVMPSSSFAGFSPYRR